MARASKLIGSFLLAIGLAAVVVFATFTIRDADFRKAALYHERNPGNAMYDMQYFVAFTRHVFLIGGSICGGFLGLNGATLLLLGVVADRQKRSAG